MGDEEEKDWSEDLMVKGRYVLRSEAVECLN
jgi:hypothetical protein